MSWLPEVGFLVLGVVIDRVFGPAIDRRLAAIRRGLRRLRGTQSISGEPFEVTPDHKVYVYEYTVQGYGSERLNCRLVPRHRDLRELFEQDPDLRDDAERLVQEVEELRSRLPAQAKASGGEWNSPTLGLTNVSFSRDEGNEDPVLALTFDTTDYATLKVVSAHWRSRASSRAEISVEELRHVRAGLSHSFGVNATIETADGQVLIARRGSETRTFQGKLHISVNEAMVPGDQRDRHPDPYSTLLRGVKEELGIDVDRERCMFHSLVFDCTNHEWGLLGHIDLRDTTWTADRILQTRQLGLPRDRFEMDELRPVPFTPRAVGEILSKPADWVPHGWLNLYLSLHACHGHFPDHQRQPWWRAWRRRHAPTADEPEPAKAAEA